MNSGAALLRQIPPVDRLLQTDEIKSLVAVHSHALVVAELRTLLDEVRERARAGELTAPDLTPAALAGSLAEILELTTRPYYSRVINATGVILHTGLGRAPLPESVADSLGERARHPVRVEIDLATGQRGGRDRGVGELLCRLTGAEAATVVNNNAGATLLILAALARGREVIVSRGELVEIGGSYRIPTIMAESGAKLREVGTTNRTHLYDYETAIHEETAMLLKVHTSNYKVEGFTGEIDIGELAHLGRAHSLPVVHDLGSGSLIDLKQYGLSEEPVTQDSLRAGADLVCFSGDKLLGGPQAGMILGRRELVERCRRHPLYRALRPDRLAYMALESVLRIYLKGERAAIEEIPALRRLTLPPEILKQRAEKLRALFEPIAGLECGLVADFSLAGSGSLPTRRLPTWVVWIKTNQTSELARSLRLGSPAVLARLRDDGLYFDVRTLEDEDLPVLKRRVRESMESSTLLKPKHD